MLPTDEARATLERLRQLRNIAVHAIDVSDVPINNVPGAIVTMMNPNRVSLSLDLLSLLFDALRRTGAIRPYRACGSP